MADLINQKQAAIEAKQAAKQQDIARAAASKRAIQNSGVPTSSEDFLILSPNATQEDFVAFQNLSQRKAINDQKIQDASKEVRIDNLDYTGDDTANALIQGVNFLAEGAYTAADFASRNNLASQIYNKYQKETTPEGEIAPVAKGIDDLTNNAGSKFFTDVGDTFNSLLQSEKDAGIKARIARNTEGFAKESDATRDANVAKGDNEIAQEIANIGRKTVNSAGEFFNNPAQIGLELVQEIPSMLLPAAYGKKFVDKFVRELPAQFSARYATSAAGKAQLSKLRNNIGGELLKREMGEAAAAKFLKTKAGKEAAGKAAAVAGISVASLQEATSNTAQLRNEILNMKPEELAEGSPPYNAYVAGGLSHEEARQRVANESGDIVFGLMLPFAGVASKFTGAAKLEGSVFLPNSKVGRSYVNALAATGVEGLEESLQGGAGEFSQNLAKKLRVDEKQALGEGVGENIGTGFAVGTGIGASLNAVGTLAPTAELAGEGGKKLAKGADKVLKEGAKKLAQATDPEAVKEARRTGDASKVTDITSPTYNEEQAFTTLISPEFFPVPRAASEGVEAELPVEFKARKDKYLDDLEIHINAKRESISQLNAEENPANNERIKKDLQTLRDMTKTFVGIQTVLGKSDFAEAIKTLKENPENKDMLLGSMRNGLSSPISVEQAKTVLGSGRLTDTETKQVEAFIQSKLSSEEVSDAVNKGEGENLGLTQYDQIITDAVNNGDADGARKALTNLASFAKGLQDKAKQARKAFTEVKASKNPNAEQNPSGKTWSLNFTKKSPERLVTNIEKDSAAVTAAFTSLRDYSATVFNDETQGKDDAGNDVRGTSGNSTTSGTNNPTGSEPSNVVSGGNPTTVQSNSGVPRGDDSSNQQDGAGNAGRVANDNAVDTSKDIGRVSNDDEIDEISRRVAGDVLRYIDSELEIDDESARNPNAHKTPEGFISKLDSLIILAKSGKLSTEQLIERLVRTTTGTSVGAVRDGTIRLVKEGKSVELLEAIRASAIRQDKNIRNPESEVEQVPPTATQEGGASETETDVNSFDNNPTVNTVAGKNRTVVEGQLRDIQFRATYNKDGVLTNLKTRAAGIRSVWFDTNGVSKKYPKPNITDEMGPITEAINAIDPDFKEEKATKTNNVNQETKGEIHDLVGILGLLGVKAKSTAQRVPSLNELMELQQKVLTLINNGKLDRKSLQAIFNDVDWAFADTSPETIAHIENRNKRAESKLEERMAKAGVETREEYLAYQIIEEIGEVGESALGKNDTVQKVLLDLQKAVLKIIRFGGDTVIKDSNGKPTGETNASRAEAMIDDSGVEFYGELSAPEDVNRALGEITDILVGRINETSQENDGIEQTENQTQNEQVDASPEGVTEEELESAIEAVNEEIELLDAVLQDDEGIELEARGNLKYKEDAALRPNQRKSLNTEIKRLTKQYENERQQLLEELAGYESELEKSDSLLDLIQSASVGLLSAGRKYANRLSKLFKVNPKDNKMSLTNDLFNEADSLEGITDEQKVALKRMGKLRDLLAAGMDKFVGMKPELNSQNPYAAIDNNMIQYLMKDGTDTYSEGLDPNVLNLITIAVAKWTATRGKETLNRTRKDIAAMLGVSEESLTEDVIEYYIEKGIPSYLISDNIGKDVVKALGLVLDKANAPREARDRMVQSIGYVAFMAMHDLNIIETTLAENVPVIKGDYVNSAFESNREGNGKSIKMSKLIQNPISSSAIGLYKEIENVLEDLTSIENEYKMPSLTAPTSVPKKNVRGTQNLTKSQRKALENYAKKAFNLDTDVMMMFDLVGDDVLKLAMGYDFSLENDSNGKLVSKSTHITKIKGAKGKNNQIERSIENLKAFAGHMLDSGNIGADFFFESVVDNNNRFRMSNKVVNPQGDKLHRAAMVMKGWAYTVDGARSRTLNMLAIGQSLGVKIDKLTIEDSLRETENKLNNPVISEGIEALRKLRSGERMDAIDTKIAQDRVAAAVKLAGEGTHSLEGLISLMDYSPTKPFTSTLSIEIDGITNGTALATLLFAPDGSADVLAKSGIFSDHNTSYGEYISKPENLDNYETLAETLGKNLKAIIAGTWEDADGEGFDPKLVALLRPIGNLLGRLGEKDSEGFLIDDATYGLVRNIAKNPVMIGNYGAGDPKITAEFVEEVLGEIYNKIQDAVNRNDQAQLDLIHTELNIVVPGVRKLTVANGMSWTMTDKQTKEFKSLVKKTFGTMMNAALQEEFAPLREARDNFNTMLNAANAMYRSAYAVESKKILDSLVPVLDKAGKRVINSNGEPAMKRKGFLSVSDEDFLNRKLAVFKPEIKHGQVLKGDSQNTHIPLNSTELTIVRESKFATEIPFQMVGNKPVNVPNYPSGNKTAKIYSPQLLPSGNGVKGTVFGVQSTDSAVATEVLLDDEPVLNVYDGFLVNPLNAINVGKLLNEATISITKRTKMYKDTAESLKKIMVEFTKDGNEAYVAELRKQDLLRKEILPKGADPKINPMDLVRHAMDMTNVVENKRKAMFEAINLTLQYNIEGGGFTTSSEEGGAEYYVKQFIREVKDSNIQVLGSSPQSGNTSYSTNQTKHEVRGNTILGLMSMLAKSTGIKSSASHAKYLKELLGDTYNSFVTTTKLKVAQGGKLNAGQYDMSSRQVKVATKSGGRTSPFEMGGDEVFAHEMIHALSAAGLETISFYANEVRFLMAQAREQLTVEHFMQAGGTREEAQERYDYIFDNPDRTAKGYSAGVHEFVAYGLTNEHFMQVLRDNVDTKRNPYNTDTSFLGKLRNLYSKLLRGLTNKVSKTSNLSADAKLNALVGQMMTHEANAKQRVYSASITNKIEDGFKAGLIKYIQQPLVKFLEKDKFSKKVNTRFKTVNVLTSAGQAAIAGASIAARGEFGEFRTAINKVSKRLGATENNLILALFTEMQGSTPETNKFYQLARESRKVLDQARADIAANVKQHVKKQFKRPLTTEEEVSLTKILLKTDLSSLTKDFNAEQISNLVTNDLFLEQEIRKTELELNQFGANTTWYKKQTNSLAQFLVTGEFTEGLGLKNAHAIARLVGLNKNVPANAEAAEAIIDKLATLKALKIAKKEIPEDMDRVVKIFKEEFVANENPEDNGVMFTLMYHEDYKERALEDLFSGNKMQTVKGYTRDIYNPNKSFQVAPEADVDLMARDGFVRTGPVSKDPADPNSLPMAMYVSDMGQMAAWQAGGVSLAGMTAKGTKYYDTAANASNVGNTTPAPSTAKTIMDRKKQIAKDIYSGRTSAFPKTTLVPIIDETGKITDFHYLMKEKTKDLLERNIRLSDVFGAMEANMKSKTAGKEINEKFTEALSKDFRDNYAVNQEKYSFVGLGSSRKDLEELYKMMPPEMRADIKKNTGDDGIWVRDEIIKLVFGQRKFSIPHYFKEKAELQAANTRLGNRYLTEVYRKLGSPRVAKIEQGWQEVIAWVKDTIVIKSIVTLIGNVASNNVLLWSLGVPVKNIVADQERAVRYAETYQANAERIQEIDREIKVTAKKQGTTANQGLIKKLQAEKTRLQDKQLSNPIHALIDAGIYQSIIDDVDALDDGFNYKTRLENWVAPVTSRVPEKLKTLAGYATLSQDNKAYQFLRRSTQLSDLAARFALHEHNLSKGMDSQQSIDMIVNVFIDYDLPTHKGIEYLNSIGAVFFTKFFLRIQKVILYTLQDEPLRFIGLHYIQELFGNISDIFDSFGLTKDLSFMFKTPLGALGGIPDMHPWLQLFM